jgi:hypothetical protein
VCPTQASLCPYQQTRHLPHPCMHICFLVSPKHEPYTCCQWYPMAHSVRHLGAQGTQPKHPLPKPANKAGFTHLHAYVHFFIPQAQAAHLPYNRTACRQCRIPYSAMVDHAARLGTTVSSSSQEQQQHQQQHQQHIHTANLFCKVASLYFPSLLPPATC